MGWAATLKARLAGNVDGRNIGIVVDGRDADWWGEKRTWYKASIQRSMVVNTGPSTMPQCGQQAGF